MPSSRYKVIMFDFFGVICSEVAPPWFAKYFSKDEALHLKEVHALPADLGEITEAEFMENLGRIAGISPKQASEEFYELAKIDQGMVELIESLRGRFKIALCSNAPASFLRTILQKHDLEKLFDEIIISGEVKLVKPNANFFENALKTLGVQKEDALFIDDSFKNIEGAEAVGIDTFHFTNKEELVEFFRN